VPRVQPQAHRWRPLERGSASIIWRRSGWYVVGKKGEAKILFLWMS
jgi:hypothetical protein